MQYQFLSKISQGDLKLIKTNEWGWDWERRMAFWLVCKITGLWVEENFGIFPAVKYTLAISQGDGFWQGYFDKESYEKEGKNFFQEVLKNKNYIKQYENSCEADIQKLKDFSRKLLKLNFKKLTTKRLLKLHEEYIQKYMKVAAYIGPVRILNGPSLNFLNEYFHTQRVSNTPQIIAALTWSKKKSVFEEFRNELLQMKKKVRNIEKIKTLELDRILEKYKWITVGYFDEPTLSRKDIIQIMKTLKEKEIPSLRPQTLSLPSEIKYAAEMMASFIYYKDEVRAVENFSIFASQSLFAEIGQRFNSNLNGVRNILPQEINLQTKEITPHLGPGLILGRRDEGVVKIFPISKKQYERFVKLHQKEFKKRAISGFPASLGKVKGKVLLLKRPKDYRSEKDFVLVTKMTTPEFIPILKEAKAIITDEGGLACHAAIISRELGIPCIIGTKNATQVLKDGDEVEVDANHGRIKITK